MNAAEIHKRLEEELGGKIGRLVADNPDPYIYVHHQILPQTCELLRDDPDFKFDFLESISGLDLGDEMVLVYHLLSYEHRHALVLRVEVQKDAPDVPTVSGVWPAANWHEREQYDLFGFNFVGHPDLRRIMLPEDWVGFPLRKDYEYPEEYHGIEHHRPSVLDGLGALDEARRK